jgi:5-methylcytosine-specific restriction endonuclease McrA
MKCLNCGIEFEPKHFNQKKFCSYKCAIEFHNKKSMEKHKKIKNCLICGKNLIGTGQQKYCFDCRLIAYKNWYEKNREKIRKKANEYYWKIQRDKLLKKRFCQICGRDLSGTQQKKVCLDCKPKYQELRLKLNEEIKNIRKYLLKILGEKCSICGSTKNLEIHHKNIGNRLEDLVLVCRKCHHKIENKNLFFVNNQGFKLKEEIKKVLKCEICGSNNNIVLHHKDGNRKNNQIENLQLLCRKCHTLTHLKDENFKERISKNWIKPKIKQNFL